MDRSTQIKAMASEQRLHILRLLASPKTHFAEQWSADPEQYGVCMSLIAEALQIAQPTASRHLDILRQAGFITVQKHMKWSYCKRNDPALEDYLRWVATDLQLGSQARSA